MLAAFRFVTTRQTPSSAPAASATIAGSHSQQQGHQQKHEAPIPFETARPEQDDWDVVDLEGPDSRPDSTTLSTSGSSGLLSGGSFVRCRLPSLMPPTPAPSLEVRGGWLMGAELLAVGAAPSLVVARGVC
jgi:hypothetical protein